MSRVQLFYELSDLTQKLTDASCRADEEYAVEDRGHNEGVEEELCQDFDPPSYTDGSAHPGYGFVAVEDVPTVANSVDRSCGAGRHWATSLRDDDEARLEAAAGQESA